MIKKHGSKFVVTDKSGNKVLGTHPTKEKAAKQLAAIEISKAKHMKENKTFKAFRSTLNESEYSEVLTGYGNRSAHKDGAGLHHLQSAGALAGVNAMLATISRGTYLDPNEALLKMKVRLNVVQLDFDWRPGMMAVAPGSYDITVKQFGRVDGYDALTGGIRFDGKANPTGGYTELNLHIDVELNPDSLFVVSAKITPVAPVVAEETQLEEKKKLTKDQLATIRPGMGKPAPKSVKEEAELDEEKDNGLRTMFHHPKGKAVVTKGGKTIKIYRTERAATKHAVTGKPVKEDYQTDAREEEMKKKIAKHDDVAQRAYQTRMTGTPKQASRAEKTETKHDKAITRLLKRDQREQDSPRTYGRGGKLVKRGSRHEVKEGVEAIEEMHKPGDTVKVPHKGKMVKGKIVRHDSGGNSKAAQHGGGYVVDVGEYGSITVPHHKIVKEAAEQIDELSKKTLGSYVKKAAKDVHGRAMEFADDAYAGRETPEQEKKMKQRHKGIGQAVKRLTKEGVEQIDELSKATKDAYVAKRGSQLQRMTTGLDRYRNLLTGKQQANAVKGIKRAMGVQEELVGGQKKLDVNKNKKLDAQDFALLRAKKKPVQEETVEEAKKFKAWTPRLDKLVQNRDAVRSKPKKKSVKEATEQLDEVSPPDMEKMTGSPRAKASFTKQYGKRGKEVMYATAWKLHNKKKAVKEETTQIDEVKKPKKKVDTGSAEMEADYGSAKKRWAAVEAHKKKHGYRW